MPVSVGLTKTYVISSVQQVGTLVNIVGTVSGVGVAISVSADVYSAAVAAGTVAVQAILAPLMLADSLTAQAPPHATTLSIPISTFTQ